MPYRPSCRASRISRLPCASVRTGTGPSWRAIPPISALATSCVRAPRSAARSAATTPAGPAPMTTTSVIGSPLLSRPDFFLHPVVSRDEAIDRPADKHIRNDGENERHDQDLSGIDPFLHDVLVD